MVKRNLWKRDETFAMLSIMKEIDFLNNPDRKAYGVGKRKIFDTIHSEMEKRGFNTKNQTQLEIRWKNLKKIYIAIRRTNNKYIAGKKKWPYYNELHQMLSSEIIVKPISKGHSKDSRNSKLGDGKKRVYNRCLKKLNDAVQDMHNNFKEDYVNRQKQLLDYEFELYERIEDQFDERWHAAASKIMDENTDRLIDGLGNLLAEHSSTATCLESKEITNVRDFIANFPGD